MIYALIAVIAVSLAVLVLVTLMQMFYLETLRLRTREVPSFQFFKEELEERVGLRGDQGATVFSLIKHIILALLGVAYLCVTLRGELLSAEPIVEASLFSFLSMLACAYVIPHVLYRRTSGHWLKPLAPILKGI